MSDSANAPLVMADEGGDDEGGGDEWMATFADMMTLLLTFFVLLLSFASMDVTKYRMALGSVRDALGVKYKHPGDIEAVSTTAIALSEREGSPRITVSDHLELLKKITKIVKDKGLENEVEVESSARGIIVRVKGQVFFGSGSADLKKQAAVTLAAVAEVCKLVKDHPVAVEGHTDDRPIHTSRFRSNWELSTGRAAAVMRDLVGTHNVAARRFSIAGYAHMRPLVPNKTAADRARNRRVEFVFVRKRVSERAAK